MSTSVTFHFTSPHFVLESGHVLFTKGARVFSDGEFRAGEIKNGAVDGVLVEGPIEFDALLGDLTVVRSEDRRRYHVAFLKVTGDLHPDDLRVGRVNVRLNVPVVIIVRVRDSTGQPLANVTVSLLLPELAGSLEAPTDDRGEVSLLGGIGRYKALIGYAGRRHRDRSVWADLEITPKDSGERVVVLTVD